jgi:hypothetical protein
MSGDGEDGRRLAAQAADWLPSPVVESMTSALLQLVAQNAAAQASPAPPTPQQMRDSALLNEVRECMCACVCVCVCV